MITTCASAVLGSGPTSDRVTVHLLLPDLPAAAVNVRLPSLLMAGALLNRALAASSHSMDSVTFSSSPAPAEMSLAQGASNAGASSSTVMGDAPAVKVGA